MFHKFQIKSSGSDTDNLHISETIVVMAILFVFLSLGFIEASKLPIYLDTWWDEILFVDPAANLYLGKGFNSSAWFAQSKDEFWAGYPPLYPLLLYLWMRIFGFGISVARSLNYVLAALSAFILWRTVIRLNLIATATWRIFLVVLLLVIVGYGFDFRPGRPDILMATLTMIAFLAYSIPRKNLRYLCLSCICIIFPFSGLGLVAYTVVFASLVLIYLKRSFFKEFIAIITGLAIGSLGLFIFYSINGVWQGFVESVVNNSSLTLPGAKGTFIDKFILNISLVFDGNRAFKILLISALAINIYRLLKRKFKFNSLASFGVAVGFGVPFTMRTIGSYPLYYDWMASLPLAVCVCSEISSLLRSDVKSWLRPPILGLTVTLLLFAPPLKLDLFIKHWRSVDYSVVENFVTKSISKEDWVMADPLTYYALKNKVEVVFHPFYIQAMSDQEKDKISLIIAKPSSFPPLKFAGDFETITNKLGGFWSDTGQRLTLQTTKSLLSPDRVELRIYTRIPQKIN